MSNEHKKTLAEVQNGDIVISIEYTMSGKVYRKLTVKKTSAQRITVGSGYPVTYRRDDGRRVGAPGSRDTIYAAGQIVVDSWGNEGEPAIMLYEKNAAIIEAERKRAANVNLITVFISDKNKATPELLKKIIDLINAECKKS